MKRMLKFGGTVITVLWLIASTARAQTEFWWTNTLDGVWSVSGNWTNTAPASGGATNYTLNFINSGNTYNVTNDLGSFLLNRLVFNNVAVSLYGDSLVFSRNGSLLPTLTQTGASNVSIYADIVQSNTTTYSVSSQLNLNGAISGTGALVKTGSGTLTLGTANTFTGGIIVSNGVLKVGNPAALGGTPTTGTQVVVVAGAALDLAGVTNTGYTAPIVIYGMGVATNFGAIGNSGGSLIWNGIRNVTLGSDAAIGSDGSRFDFTGLLDGRGFTLTKVGNDYIAIQNATNLAALIISNGTWSAEGNNALGGASVTTAPQGVLQLVGAIAFTNSLTMYGGTLKNYNGTNAWNGPITLMNNTTNYINVGVNAGGIMIIGGHIGGTGVLWKTGAYTLILTNSNTYLGQTIYGGTGVTILSNYNGGVVVPGNLQIGDSSANNSIVYLGGNEQIADNAILTFSGNWARFVLLGYNETIGGLSEPTGVNGLIEVSENANWETNAGPSTLTINISTNLVFAGYLRDYRNAGPSNRLSLVVSGTGTQTLAGANITFSGGAWIKGNSTLVLSNTAANNSVITNDATLVFAGSQTRTTLVTGVGVLMRAADDGGETVLRGANTYTGGTVINGGRIRLDTTGSSNVFGTGSITITNVGQLYIQAANTLTNAFFISGLGYPDTNGRIGALRLEANSTLTGPITLLGNARIGNNGGTGYINGPISGNYNLEFFAYPGSAGTIVLSGSNTYTGSTTITNGMTVSVNRIADSGVSGIGYGNLVFGNGTLTYTGSGSDTTARSVTIATNANFNIATAGATLTLNGAVSGSGGNLIKTGPGILQLAGTNTYDGGTAINGGLLLFASTNAIPTAGSVLVSPGGAVAGNFTNLMNNLLPRLSISSGGLLALLTTNATENINFSTGSYSNLGLGAAVNLTYGGTYTPYQSGGTNYYRLGAIAAATLTYTNPLVNGSSAAALIINQGGSGGRVILTTNSTYSGPTAINGGTLTIGIANALPTSTALTIGDTNSAGSLDLSNFSQTISKLTFASTNASLTNTVFIGAGQTLNLSGTFTNASGSASNSTTITKITGPGSFTVTNLSGSFSVGGAANGTVTYVSTLDMSELNAFNANISNGTFRISFLGAGSGTGTLTLSLATNSIIRAATLGINDNSDKTAGMGTLNLGAGTNALYVNTINVGGGKNSAAFQFLSSTSGILTISNSTGTGRATLNVGVTTQGTGANQSGLFDVRGHESSLYLGTVTVGGRTAGLGGNGAGYFYFDRGVLDATNLLIGTRTGGSAGIVTGEVHIAGGVVNLGVVRMANNAVDTNNPVIALLELSGGNINISSNIIKVGGITTGAQAFATLILSNTAVLNMNGYSIGDSVNPIDTLIFEGGTLKNVAEINGGLNDLVKTGAGTLILDGTNAYSGRTVINGGLVLINQTNSFPCVNYLLINAGGALARNFGPVADDYSNPLTYLVTDSAGMLALLATNVTDNYDFNNLNIFGQNYPYLILGAATNLTYGGTYTPYVDGDGIRYYRLGALNGVTFTFTNVISDGSAPAELHINEGGYGGTVVLTASNTYTGVSIIETGMVLITSATALGSAAGGTVVSNGAQLQLSGNITVAEPITINGHAQYSYTGALRSLSGTNTWSGLITLGSDARIRVDSGSALYITGGVTNQAGNTMFVANPLGTLIFTNNPMYLGNNGTLLVHAGNSIVAAAGNILGNIAVQYNGILTLGANNPFPSYTALTLGDTATNSGTLNLNGYNQTFASITTLGLKSTNCLITSATPATLTISNTVANTYDGRMTGAMSLTKDGSGTLTLTKNSLTYTGDTTILAGTLALGTGAAAPNTARFVLSPGAFLDVTGMGGLSLASGQELKGSGTVLGSVIAGNGSQITPGNSVGTLTVGNLTLTNGVLLNFELGPTNNSDLVIVTGALSFAGMQTNWFVFSAVSGFGVGTYTLFDAASLGSSTLGAGTNFANIGGSGLSGYLWLDNANADVKLTVVPEPTADTLVGAGLLAMFWLLRRRART